MLGIFFSRVRLLGSDAAFERLDERRSWQPVFRLLLMAALLVSNE
jgi:hypothetical protein